MLSVYSCTLIKPCKGRSSWCETFIMYDGIRLLCQVTLEVLHAFFLAHWQMTLGNVNLGRKRNYRGEFLQHPIHFGNNQLILFTFMKECSLFGSRWNCAFYACFEDLMFFILFVFSSAAYCSTIFIGFYFYCDLLHFLFLFECSFFIRRLESHVLWNERI